MARTRMYKLHLSHNIRGMAAGPVRAVEPIGVVFDLDEAGNQVVPDKAAVRECLPSCYRKAFDNAGFSQASATPRMFFWKLYSTRGKYLNTVYAFSMDVDNVRE